MTGRGTGTVSRACTIDREVDGASSRADARARVSPARSQTPTHTSSAIPRRNSIAEATGALTELRWVSEPARAWTGGKASMTAPIETTFESQTWVSTNVKEPVPSAITVLQPRRMDRSQPSVKTDLVGKGLTSSRHPLQRRPRSTASCHIGLARKRDHEPNTPTKPSAHILCDRRGFTSVTPDDLNRDARFSGKIGNGNLFAAALPGSVAERTLLHASPCPALPFALIFPSLTRSLRSNGWFPRRRRTYRRRLHGGNLGS